MNIFTQISIITLKDEGAAKDRKIGVGVIS